MTRPRTVHPSKVRRRTAQAAAGALLVPAALGVLSTAAAAGPVLQAVVSYDTAVVQVQGVRVVRSLPAVHLAVVRGDAAALARLARTPGVRGVAPDDAMHVTSRDEHGAGGVLAADGLGGNAGRAGAGAGVRVAVIDTGVSDTAALSRAGGQLTDGVDTTDPEHPVSQGPFADGFGHGTFMATLVAGGSTAATGGRALGVAPGATVVVVRVAGPDGSTHLSQVVAGLNWVAAHPGTVDVANLSLSRDKPFPAYGADPLTDAVERVRDAGVTMVVSAGNQTGTLSDPGFDPKALTAGAADLPSRRVASFSGSGTVAGVSKPEVVASGVSVLGLLPPDSVIARAPGTAHLAGGLFRGSGTSQAAAVTSGTAALLLAAHPGASPAQVKASLRCAAVALHGEHGAAGLLQATTELCSGPDGTALDGSGDLTGEASFDASSWGASSWGASSWGASSWGASAWSAHAWSAHAWSASSWGIASPAGSSWTGRAPAGSSWTGRAPAGSSWTGRAPAASSWGIVSPAASSWGIVSPAASSWGIVSPAASSSWTGRAPAASSWGIVSPAASSWGIVSPAGSSWTMRNRVSGS